MVTKNLPFEQIISSMTDMLFIMSVDSSSEFRYAKMNPSAMRVSGLNDYAYGATFQDVVQREEAEVLQSHYQKALQFRKPVSFILNHEGQIGESVLNPIFDAYGQCTHILGTVRDITSHYELQEQLTRQAQQDALTGLFNRHGLEHKLQQTIKEARRTGTLFSVFVIDCDNLKRINDTFGHIIGDLYLLGVAERISQAVRKDDFVSRFGGDEFLVVAKIVDELESRIIAERILQAFRTPWLHEEISIRMSVSIGIATYPMDGVGPWDVIRSADKALYQAKEKGRQRYEVFRSPRHSAISPSRSEALSPMEEVNDSVTPS